MADITAACLKIGKTIREEGETAFPSIAVLESELKSIMVRRQNDAYLQAMRDEENAIRRDRAENPENYLPTEEDKAFTARLNEKLATIPSVGQSKSRQGAIAGDSRPYWERKGMTEEEYEADIQSRRDALRAYVGEVQ